LKRVQKTLHFKNQNLSRLRILIFLMSVAKHSFAKSLLLQLE